MTGKADAVRAVSQQFKDRTNAVIDGVMAHLRDDNAKEILGPGLSSLIGRGSLKSIVTFALYADVLRMVWDMVMADGEISDEEVQESLGLLAVVASGFAKVRKEYASFTQLTPETARQFLSQYESDSGLFGHANEATKWSGVTLCRNTQIHCSDPGPFDVFSDSLIAWAKKLAASDETAESEQDVLDSLHSITTRPGRILTKAIAEQFLKDPDSLSLQRFATLEDDAAAVLASSREDLRLSGLTQISAAAAQALMPHVGAILFGALETLTLPAAQALSQHIGPLRDLDVLRFVEKYPVFAALRRHPSLVVQVIEDESLTSLLRTKDIDNDEYYDFEFADAASRELCDEEYYGNPMDDGLHLLTRAEGRPVWRIPLSSVNDAWERDNAAAYTLYFIGAREAVIERLARLPDRVITPEVAHDFLRQENVEQMDFLGSYGALDLNAAAILAKDFPWGNYHELWLSGLRSLPHEVAAALSTPLPHDDQKDSVPTLVLGGLKEVSEATAQALSMRKWGLQLSNLRTLSHEAAKYLGQIPYLLVCVEELSEAAAAGLTPVRELEVRVPYLQADVASQLSKVAGSLSIVVAEELSAEAAAALGTRRGLLYVGGLPSLSEQAAKGLASHEGTLCLGVKTMSSEAARILCKHDGKLEIGLQSLPQEVAEILKQHPSL